MRILQVFEPPEGGVRAHVHTLTRELARRGHEVEVVVTSHSRTVAQPFEDLGVRVHRADLAREIHAVTANLRGFADLRRIIRRGRFDIVHVHDAKAGALGRPAARAVRTPVVYSPHGFVYQSQLERERPGRRARRALTLGIERALAPLAAAIVCISEDERSTALHDRVAGAERLRLVHAGVPLDPPGAAHPSLLEFRGDGPLVGFVGRLEEEKGLAVLVEALRELAGRERLPRVAIVGNGSMRHWLARKVAPFAARVRLEPFAGTAPPYLAALDLLLVPSLREGLPIVALEAMAAGLPVVASRIAGLPEAVADGETGVLVPPGDAVALAGAVDGLLADPDRLGAMGAAGRERCRERFALPAMIDGIEAIYAEVAGRARAATPASSRSTAAS